MIKGVRGELGIEDLFETSPITSPLPRGLRLVVGWAGSGVSRRGLRVEGRDVNEPTRHADQLNEFSDDRRADTLADTEDFLVA